MFTENELNQMENMIAENGNMNKYDDLIYEIQDIDEESSDGVQYQEFNNYNIPEEEYFCEGGPLKSDIAIWKKQYTHDGGGVYTIDNLVEGVVFVYRTITRLEYKEIMAVPNSDALQREERIVNKCLLYPTINFETMALTAGGLIGTIAQKILESSKFFVECTAIKL